jgi:hypothetical protein
VNVAECVADFVDNQGELAVRALAKIHGKWIEGIVEQLGVAQQQHPAARQISGLSSSMPCRAFIQ